MQNVVILLACSLLIFVIFLSRSSATFSDLPIRARAAYIPAIRLIKIWSNLPLHKQNLVLEAMRNRNTEFVITNALRITWGPHCDPLSRCLKRYLERESFQLFVLDEKGKAVATDFATYRGAGPFLVLVVVDVGASDPTQQVMRMESLCAQLDEIAGAAQLISCSMDEDKVARDLSYLAGLSTSIILQHYEGRTYAVTEWDGEHVVDLVNDGAYFGQIPIAMSWESVTRDADVREVSAHEVYNFILYHIIHTQQHNLKAIIWPDISHGCSCDAGPSNDTCTGMGLVGTYAIQSRCYHLTVH